MIPLVGANPVNPRYLAVHLGRVPDFIIEVLLHPVRRLLLLAPDAVRVVRPRVLLLLSHGKATVREEFGHRDRRLLRLAIAHVAVREALHTSRESGLAASEGGVRSAAAAAACAALLLQHRGRGWGC